MNIAILGFDTDGRASYDFLSRDPANTLTICDQKADLQIPAGAEAVLGDSYLDNLDRFDLIIRTAGMQPRKILDKNPTVGPKISTHINEFYKVTPTRNIIGVTGTKGKGTTSVLIAKMLEASGKTVRLGGNIGLPPLTFIDEIDADSWVVLELSSFQLSDIQESPHIAVCLMIAPEHLDWHEDLEDYLTAKEQLFARQGTADVAIYYHDNAMSKRIASAGQGHKVPYYHSPGAEVVEGKIVIDGHDICRTDELQILGKHNWQNICAAITAVWHACLEVCGPSQTPDIQAIRSVLTQPLDLPYRLQLIRQLDGVSYYDDSLGTTPETTIVALEAFTQPKILILGGSDKGVSYDELAKAVAGSNTRQVLLIGDQAGRIGAALREAGFTHSQPGGDTMTEIVAKAAAAAEPGDVVLLSPACASFGMFKNYKDRGDQFDRAVREL
jgi:UDP-N-acetylmuramoylalanine--D-glutamate ligase